MPLLKRILDYVSFGKKDDMNQPEKFEPTDILKHRYQDPKVLVSYLKTLGFTDDQITVKHTGDGQVGLRLPRKLEKEEVDGALKAFIQAERDRQNDDGD